MLKTIVEFFIPPSDIRDIEDQRRIRLIAYTLFITAIFSLFYVAISWAANFKMGELIMFLAFIVFTILIFLLKARLDIFIISNAFGLAGIVCISGCIYYSGGLQSPVLPWLATTPIIILLLAGKKSGSFWAIIAVLIIIIFTYLNFVNYPFPESSLFKNGTFTLSCYSGLVLIIFFISIVFENVRARAFNAELLQKKRLQQTIVELKSTQAQLIQSEKMASLGELTAGIAHEIQNPLNFVNNFSDVSNELIDEMKEELNKGDIEEAKAIADEVKQNLEKIVHHGKRADAIVKGMLQHSRKNTGIKEPTDINALADEYLRLSYHGLRAKDKTFNADFKTDFDESIGKIDIVPQDIGRVLLNLFTNAFYAVSERQKLEEANYNPLVSIQTKKLDDKIEIIVKDNGIGISQNIIDKVFQPFFTTKPAGQGTGLGLSLAYDIITKEHNGSINVASKEKEETIFLIELPI